MNSEEIKKEMERIDREGWHLDADELLIKVLRNLGYNKLCDWWENYYKWFV